MEVFMFAVRADNGIQVENIQHNGERVTVELRLVQADPLPPVEVEPGLLEKVGDVFMGLALPLAGVGVHAACVAGSEATGCDLNVVVSGALVIGSAAFCKSGNIRSATLRGLGATASLAVSCFRGIGQVTGWVAQQAPVLTGLGVTGAALYGAKEGGLI